MGDDEEGGLQVAGQQLPEPGQGPGFHVLEAFAPGDARRLERSRRRASSWLGYCSMIYCEGEALPGTEINLPELWNYLRGKTPAPADDLGAAPKEQVRSEPWLIPHKRRPPELRRQFPQLPFARRPRPDIVVAVVAVGMAVGHLAVAHLPDKGRWGKGDAAWASTSFGDASWPINTSCRKTLQVQAVVSS